MEVLEEGGFEGPNVVTAYALIPTYWCGRYRVAIEHHDLEPTQIEEDEQAQSHDDTVQRMTPFTANLVARDYYSFGIEPLIYGLRSHLRRQTAPAVPTYDAPPPPRPRTR